MGTWKTSRGEPPGRRASRSLARAGCEAEPGGCGAVAAAIGVLSACTQQVQSAQSGEQSPRG